MTRTSYAGQTDLKIQTDRSPGDREESILDTRIMERAKPCLKQLKQGGKILGKTAKMLLETTVQDVMTKAAGAGAEQNQENVAGKKNYALITGASSGIGLEFARRLSLEGYPLILIARRRDRLEMLRRELGTECLLLPADLSRHEDLIRLCEDLVGRKIDIFINNAGFGVAGPFMGTDLLREVNMIDVNVTAQHVLFKYILHRMDAEGGGSILNVASSAGLFPAGPFRVAVMRGLDVLAVNVMKIGAKRYKIIITPLHYDKTATRQRQTDMLADAYVAELEKVLRCYPTQWYNYFEFWNETN